MAARATAPDERNDQERREPVGAAPVVVAGPAVLVHIDSAEPATLVRLGANGDIVDRCSAPCDLRLPVEGTYRIDGPTIRSSWPLHLIGGAADRVVLSVSPHLRSSYSTGRTLGNVGVVVGGIGLGVALFGALAATSAFDAKGGAPAPCTACAATEVGGGILMIAGIGMGTVGVVMALANLSSGASQRREAPAQTSSEPPRYEGIRRMPETTKTALPGFPEAEVLRLRF